MISKVIIVALCFSQALSEDLIGITQEECMELVPDLNSLATLAYNKYMNLNNVSVQFDAELLALFTEAVTSLNSEIDAGKEECIDECHLDLHPIHYEEEMLKTCDTSYPDQNKDHEEIIIQYPTFVPIEKREEYCFAYTSYFNYYIDRANHIMNNVIDCNLLEKFSDTYRSKWLECMEQ